MTKGPTQPQDDNRKRRLIVLIGLILITGFLTAGLVSYFASVWYFREQITSDTLPLTSDNIYSEIQRDLIRPVFISSLMANNSFLRDWILNGEQDEALIRKYLHQVMVRYETFTSFLVSEKTRIYYQAKGVLKQVKPEEPRDKWYFRVREMEQDYEINIDPDLANQDAMTIFINHRVYDYQGNYIGATGVGLTIRAVSEMMARYRAKYNRSVWFIDAQGRIVLRSDAAPESQAEKTISQISWLAPLAADILSGKGQAFEGRQNGYRVHLNSRFLPELNWYLLVSQIESQTPALINRALVVNLMLCGLITAVVVVLTTLTINVYQKINQRQHDEILAQHQQLLAQNAELQSALAEVKKLGGLLPICASCKKIRDDKGYWQQIELYIRDHSEADFTHGICPECSARLYPNLIKKKAKDGQPPGTG